MAFSEGVAPNGKSYKIAICEDKGIDAQQMRSFLESREYKVVGIFDNGRKFLDWYVGNTGTIDCLILDIVMPVLDGYTTYNELQSIKPPPRVVFVSVENTAGLIKRVFEMGAYDFITKPLKREPFLERIAKVVRKPLPPSS